MLMGSRGQGVKADDLKVAFLGVKRTNVDL